MKNINRLLIAAAFPLAVSGVLGASGFEKDILGVEAALPAIKASSQTPPQNTRWWSTMASSHEYIMKAVLKAIDPGQFPDIRRFNTALMQGTNDETGHPDPSDNGGKPRDIWFGKDTETAGGVLPNYELLEFDKAYAKLGLICHLTQDQGVPAHAANIRHGYNESFEAYYPAEGNKVEVRGVADGALEPYAYYQQLQDETRRQLPSWVNPDTGKPYWIAAPDAPPLGQDVTYGPRGRYGSGAYTHNGEGNQTETSSPEIRVRQLTASALATMNVLASASKRLPPLVSVLTLSAAEARIGEVIDVSFKILDNRSRNADFTISIYKDGALKGVVKKGKISLAEPKAPDVMFNARVAVPLVIDGAVMPAGNYVVDVRAIDEDGNTTPDEVNLDGIAANNTKAVLTVK
jgi:hypothetical protein